MKEDWKECKLGEVCYFAKDKVSVSELNNDIYISTENMMPNRGGITKATNLPTGEQTPSFESGDILVSNIRPYFKKIWKATFSGGCSADVLNFKAKNNIANDFLYYVLSDDEFFKYCMTTSKGTKMPRGDKVAIMQYPITLPPLATQQKIATILSSLDDKIELNNKINDNLEQQAQAIFKSWFVDFEPFGGKMPEGWKEKPLYDYADFINGTSFKEDEYDTKGVPIIKIAELKNGITDATQYFNGEKDPKYDVKNGDILFSWSGNPETSIDIFIWSLGDGILNQHTFNVKSNTDRKWFTYCLLKYFKPEFCHRASCKQTTGLGHVTANDLKQITFNSGEKEESNFEALITPIMNQIFNNKIENQKLLDIRDTLLPKLMNGEIEV